MVEHTLHTVSVPAPVELVYDLIADVTNWPTIFGPTVHVEHLERSESEEVFRIWALANGAVKSWTSRRTLDPVAREITFEQQVSQPPVASMGGTWRFTAEPDGATTVELHHHYSAVDDDPQARSWIERALESNSQSELAGLVRAAESAGDAQLYLRFSDSVSIEGPAELAYRFIDEADQWPNRLPHVDGLDLSVDDNGVQHMSMLTLAPDGSRHTTTSVRLRFSDSIVYKQTGLPALLTSHTGRWLFETGADSTLVTSEHTVTIDPGAVEKVLGAGKTIADARAFVRHALGTNSTITLTHAKEFAEAGAASRTGQ